jgi:hypothetical protein
MKNRKLVSKRKDFELLELTRTQTQRNHRERPPKQQIHQRHNKGGLVFLAFVIDASAARSLAGSLQRTCVPT